MNKSEIIELLKSIEEGRLSSEAGFDAIAHLPFKNIECAKLDSHRPLRNGFSETLFCQGKDIQDILNIVKRVFDDGNNLLATRAMSEVASRVIENFPLASYDERSMTLKLVQKRIEPVQGNLAVVSAGTADQKVADEAYETAAFFGASAKKFYDVGIAGLPRLLSCVTELKEQDVVIVIAGMEGALPSVLGGLISKPIIAVPTSVGYGTHLNGITPLFAMLSSCAEGITVVNIDNGFGAACAALRILRNVQKNF